MNIAALFLMVSSLFVALTATAQEVDEEAVAVMKTSYYAEFANLPPSRNCEQGDIKGLWVEQAVLENPVGEEFKLRQEKGDKYLRFGAYNQYSQVRSQKKLAHDAVQINADDTLKQYIVSVRGLLYFYEKSVLQETKLCFIATETNKEHVVGEMLLMKLVEEETPKSLSIFRPVSVFVEKEKKNVR